MSEPLAEKPALRWGFIFYKNVLSPVLHGLSHTFGPVTGGCRFQPSCSEYAYVAIERFGLLRGGGLALWRLLRCHPFTRGGVDTVPLG